MTDNTQTQITLKLLRELGYSRIERDRWISCSGLSRIVRLGTSARIDKRATLKSRFVPGAVYHDRMQLINGKEVLILGLTQLAEDLEDEQPEADLEVSGSFFSTLDDEEK